MPQLRGYEDEQGHRPCAAWLDGLDSPPAAKAMIVLTRIERGNFSNVKGVGAGVYECRIDFGPGYRGSPETLDGLQTQEKLETQ